MDYSLSVRSGFLPAGVGNYQFRLLVFYPFHMHPLPFLSNCQEFKQDKQNLELLASGIMNQNKSLSLKISQIPGTSFKP